MEKATMGWEKKARRGAVLLGCAACLTAAAQEPDAREATAEAMRHEAPLRMELKTSSLPRLDAEDAGFQAPRMDLSLLPSGRSGMGFVAGMSPAVARSPANPSAGPARASLDVGVQWRQHLAGSRQIDVTAWRRMAAPPDAYEQAQLREPVYGARVEMNVNAKPKSGLLASTGFVGMQLQGGARISIKRKNGGPMVYYRTSF